MENELSRCLSDCGCSSEIIKEIETLQQNGNGEEALRKLRRVRCDLMEQLHESQKKVDCLDYLIRTQKQSI